jgi:STE24 endopeptidase
MSPQNILIFILCLLGAEFLLERILDFLNLSRQDVTIPEEAKEIYDPPSYSKSLSYNIAKTNFTFFTSSFALLVSMLMLGLGGFGVLDEFVRSKISGELWVSLSFFAAVFLASDILQLPFQLYNTFVIEEKFGFNKTTLSTFIADKVKGYFLAAILGGLIAAIFLTLIDKLGADFWIYFLVVIALFMIVMNLFYTSLILPIFNKLTPLEDGELKTEITKYANKVGFPLDNIYVIDGSKRSSKANAFFSGMGKRKKIVLYDTLIKNHSTNELVAVLAHEVGHFKKKHIILGMILSILVTGITLYVMSLIIFNQNLSLALGGTRQAIHLNLIAFGILYSPISMITGIFMNMLSRKNEFQADKFAVDTFPGPYLEKALKGLSVNNLSNLTPHPAYVFFHYSHPPLLQRLSVIRKNSRVDTMKDLV